MRTGGTAVKKVPAAKVVTTSRAWESPLPAEIQEALGELVGAAREGLLALSVGVGLGVVRELMEVEVDEVVGPKGKHDPDRVAVRHGYEDGSMTLGGRRVPVKRPRMRSADGEHELTVAAYEYFADRDPLTRAVMDRMLAGVSTRKYARVGEPVGTDVEASSSATGKSTVSEVFVERWRDGDMRKRWTAAGMLVAEQQFRKIIGYRDLATLVIAVERHALHTEPTTAHTTPAPEAAATTV